jgi:hypothetical protein
MLLAAATPHGNEMRFASSIRARQNYRIAEIELLCVFVCWLLFPIGFFFLFSKGALASPNMNLSGEWH